MRMNLQSQEKKRKEKKRKEKKRKEKKRKEKSTLFSVCNGSLLRRQPGALAGSNKDAGLYAVVSILCFKIVWHSR